MINKIDSIQNFGIYKDYKSDSKLKDFNKFNLLYGWNGSGKTTISRLFRIIEKKEIQEGYSNIRFKFIINSQEYNEKNFRDVNENVFVFNEEFINENINWDERINKILLLSEDKIKETQEYSLLKETINGNEKTQTKGLKKIYIEKRDELDKEFRKIDEIYSKIAKNIKNIFQTIDPLDKAYSTLNKIKIQNVFSTKEQLDEILKNNLEKEEIDNLIMSIKTEKKEKINYEKNSINKIDLMKLYFEIKEEMSKIVTAKVIERLKENTDISNWVNQGLQLRKKYKSDVCEFCGNLIHSNRIHELEEHFNDEVSEIKMTLEKLLEKLIQYKMKPEKVIMDKSLFYKEKNFEIDILNKQITEKIYEINSIIEEIEKKIEEKKNNPFLQIELDNLEMIETAINKYNEYINIQEGYVKETNDKTDNFEKQIQETKVKLARYYMKEEFKTENIIDKNKEYIDNKEKVAKIKKELNEKEIRLSELENTLSNETLGAEKFNEKLNAFIGYDELHLEFNEQLKGYEIIRKSTKSKAFRLSEGEKTAIAFVYFLTKLKENNNKIEDSIIVIDDPISSFDNNKLFSAYSSIRYEFDNCKQLFVLTHNFNFFKMMRDWIKSKKDSNNEEKYYSIYKIEPDIKEGIRKGNLKNASKSLNQTSEYDYVFECVYKFKDKELNETDIFNCGNACRKLLEAFLSFKFPKQRGDIHSLLDKAFCTKEEDQSKNRIYKFINAYSHLNVIESAEMSDIDTLLAESKGIVTIILNKIEQLDKEHYKAMVHNSISTSEI